MASPTPTIPEPLKFTRTHWLICIIASIGFAFDIYELLMLPLIIKPALASLGGVNEAGIPNLLPGSPEYVEWARMLFFVPALAGGVFGLLGGYLTDLLGRRRVLTYSILLYAISAFAAGYATNLYQLLFLRCLVFIGVCVEFVAAVAWLAELFPNPKQREKVLGYTQAFSSLGGFLVAFMNGYAAEHAGTFPAIHGGHEAWRYTLISGVIPALPLILIRPFLPESPVWQRKREAGQLKRPSIRALFSPELRRTTIATTIVFAASYGIAFGAIQQLPQILGAPGKGQKEVLAIGKAAQDKAIADAQAAGKPAPPEGKLKQIGANAIDGTVAHVTKIQEMGGLLGRCALAFLAVIIVGRRTLLRIFQIPALIFVPLYFWWVSNNLTGDTLTMIQAGIFIAGFLTVAQFSFWGNYIPRVFPVHLRGTGESFAANIGGRVIGTAAAWITLTLAESKPPNPAKIALMGAFVAGGYALVGAILTQWLPEPKAEEEEH
ncbi:MFS transporter [Roseimicrobium gellanilyticum]|uniref:MFS transporter n=1 Tax=Roseimicrobium gellanilyticum TaxID=748857 RepID=A0A366HKS6_9BACT|nr:MFS transporter [Roseimicrobium gellanilyticum]RBP42363.1 MFS transporter [Roseimicrobium gellanilyticum]